MKFKHIIWDWNGTLLDDLQISLEAINSILLKWNKKKISLEYHREHFCFPIKEYYTKLSLPTDNKNFNILCNEFNNYYNQNWEETKLHKLAIQVLKKIASKGLSQSILSAQENTQLNKLIDFYKIRKYFTTIIGLTNNKAEGKFENGQDLLLKLNIPKQKILLIGDTVYDYNISKKLGIKCILFNGGHQSKTALSKNSIESINSLEEILKTITN